MQNRYRYLGRDSNRVPLKYDFRATQARMVAELFLMLQFGLLSLRKITARVNRQGCKCWVTAIEWKISPLRKGRRLSSLWPIITIVICVLRNNLIFCHHWIPCLMYNHSELVETFIFVLEPCQLVSVM
jgi:hypothetical protein